ncbi:hypothetical protein ACFLWV_00445 [Chloroflexota bacterium]
MLFASSLPQVSADGIQWQARFVVAGDGVSDPNGVAAVAVDAGAGYDTYDVPNPPPALLYLLTSISHLFLVSPRYRVTTLIRMLDPLQRALSGTLKY